MYYNYFITHLISWPVPLHKAECSKWHYVHSVRGFSTRPATLRGGDHATVLGLQPAIKCLCQSKAHLHAFHVAASAFISHPPSEPPPPQSTTHWTTPDTTHHHLPPTTTYRPPPIDWWGSGVMRLPINFSIAGGVTFTAFYCYFEFLWFFNSNN